MRTSTNLLALVFVLWSCCAGAATVVTKTIKEDGSGDYTSLFSWEAARQRDLVAADEIEVAVIQGTWTNSDSTKVQIYGWNTDATHYIVITNSTSKHDGKRYGSASGAYRLEVSDDGALIISEDYVRVYGLQVKCSNVTADRIAVSCTAQNSSSEIIIANCIISGSSSANGAGIRGIFPESGNGTVKVFNCLGHGLKSQDNADGIFIRGEGAAMYVFNCTGFGNYIDYWKVSTTFEIYNSISQDAAYTSGFVNSPTGNYNCSSKAADAPGANSVNSYNVAFVSESAGSEDLHITAANTSIIDVTSDQSGGLFSNDIDWQTRTGSWDIGADEFVLTSSGQVIIVTSQ